MDKAWQGQFCVWVLKINDNNCQYAELCSWEKTKNSWAVHIRYVGVTLLES